MNRELLQQALDALKWNTADRDDDNAKRHKAIAALEAELSKPEQPDLRKAADMAIPLLVAYQDYTGDSRIANKCGEAIEALRQALAQPEQSKYSDIVSDGGFDPRNKYDAQPEQNPTWGTVKYYCDRIAELEAEVKCEERRFNDLWDKYAKLTQPAKHDKRFVNGALPMGGMGFKVVQALAQPEHPLDKKADNARELGLDYEPEQEPVAWQNLELPMEFYEYEHLDPMWHHHYRPLYTSPPSKEWRGLTDEEIIDAYGNVNGKEWAIGGLGDVVPFTRAIETKLKEKNER